MTTFVKKYGRSLFVLIPIPLSRRLGLREGARVALTAANGTLTVRCVPSRPHRKLSDLVREMDHAASRRHRSEAGGEEPVGNEVW